jgi:branched-chain amino acid transport system ATP-binding protein
MGGYRLARDEVTERTAEIFDRFPALRRLSKRTAGTLSGGERKLLGIARALIARPAVLMLDEPTANLAPAVAGRVLGEVVAGLVEGGTAVLLIEQRIALALDYATQVYVLVDGTPASPAARRTSGRSGTWERSSSPAAAATRTRPSSPVGGRSGAGRLGRAAPGTARRGPGR